MKDKKHSSAISPQCRKVPHFIASQPQRSLKCTLGLCAVLFAIPATTEAATLVYNSYTRISGSGDWDTGDQLRFNDVTAGVDAIVTIGTMVNARIAVNDIDRLGEGTQQGYADNWQPFITGVGNPPGNNNVTSVTFNVQFVIANTTTNTTLNNFDWSALDVDGGGGSSSIREFVRLSGLTGGEGSGPNQFTLYPGTLLTAFSLGGGNWEFRDNSQPYTAFDGIFADEPTVAVTAHYSSVSSFTLTMGFYADDPQGVVRQFSEGTQAVVIPEPAAAALGLIGTLLLLRRKRVS